MVENPDMVTRIDPPRMRTKAYERYTQQLLAWREVTDLRKDKKRGGNSLTRGGNSFVTPKRMIKHRSGRRYLNKSALMT